jgi:hypothetical protein
MDELDEFLRRRYDNSGQEIEYNRQYFANGEEPEHYSVLIHQGPSHINWNLMRDLSRDADGYIIPAGTKLFRSAVTYEEHPQPRYDPNDTGKTGVYFSAFHPHFAKTMMTVRDDQVQWLAKYYTNRDIHGVSPWKYEPQREFLNRSHIEFGNVVASPQVTEGDKPFAELFLRPEDLDAVVWRNAEIWTKREAQLATHKRRRNPRRDHRKYDDFGGKFEFY